MSKDAFKTLTGAPIVPRYEDHGVPEDAFALPNFEQRPIAPDDQYLASRVRAAADALGLEICTAKKAGLTVDITWDYEAVKPSVYIVREF